MIEVDLMGKYNERREKLDSAIENGSPAEIEDGAARMLNTGIMARNYCPEDFSQENLNDMEVSLDRAISKMEGFIHMVGFEECSEEVRLGIYKSLLFRRERLSRLYEQEFA